MVSGSDDATIRIWEVLSGRELKVLKGFRGVATSVVFSADGTKVASGHRDDCIRLWPGDIPKC